MRTDASNRDLTLYLTNVNEIFSKANPYFICPTCWSIESRDTSRNHHVPLLKRKDIFPLETEKRQGMTVVSKMRKIASDYGHLSVDLMKCFVITKNSIICSINRIIFTFSL